MKHLLVVCCVSILAVSATSITAGPTKDQITQAELVRRTQKLMDAVAPGDQAPWKKYFADDAMYFDEKGRAMDKPALVADVQPMPKGYSGAIKIVNPKSHIESNVAILSYDMDETETVWGQTLTARYHATDTWMLRKGEWKIVAGQVLRYYEDPAPGKSDVARFADYAGTYELGPDVTMSITADATGLFAQRGTRPKAQLIPEAKDIFFRKGVEGRLLFHYAENGKVDSLIDRRNNEDLVWKKIK
jgi:hypothetical protein